MEWRILYNLVQYALPGHDMTWKSTSQSRILSHIGLNAFWNPHSLWKIYIQVFQREWDPLHNTTILVFAIEVPWLIGLVVPAIGLNKSRKLARLIAPAHNVRGKVSVKSYMASKTITCCLWSHVCCFSLKLCRVYCVGAISRVSF